MWPFKKKHFSDRGLTPEEGEIWNAGHDAGVDMVIEKLGDLDDSEITEPVRRVIQNFVLLRAAGEVGSNPTEVRMIAADLREMVDRK